MTIIKSSLSAKTAPQVKYTSFPSSTNKPNRANKLFINVSSMLILSMLALATPANASSCKGLSIEECDQNAACGWVKGYERKDGRTVKAFCRTSRAGVSSKAAGKPAAEGLVGKLNSKTN